MVIFFFLLNVLQGWIVLGTISWWRRSVVLVVVRFALGWFTSFSASCLDWLLLGLQLVLLVNQLHNWMNVFDRLILLQRLLIHLFDSVGDQLLQLWNNDWCNTLNQLLHLVQALLGLVHVLLLELGNEITEDIVFLVMEPTKHTRFIDIIRPELS